MKAEGEVGGWKWSLLGAAPRPGGREVPGGWEASALEEGDKIGWACWRTSLLDDDDDGGHSAC